MKGGLVTKAYRPSWLLFKMGHKHFAARGSWEMRLNEDSSGTWAYDSWVGLCCAVAPCCDGPLRVCSVEFGGGSHTHVLTEGTYARRGKWKSQVSLPEAKFRYRLWLL